MTASQAEFKPYNPLTMAIFGIIVGIIAGLGAVLFRGMIGFVHNVFFLGEFHWHYDANLHTPAGPFGVWIIFVPVIGAVAVAWLVKTFAPEAKGHGVPEVMAAIYHEKGKIRPVVAVVKSLASSISIGTGGSIGREGPIVQIGAAFGSTFGSILKMPPAQVVILIAAGAGGGIAATFNAPIGGFAFAIELMLVSVTASSLLPVALATVTAAYIGRFAFGVISSFDIANFTIGHHLASLWLLVIAVIFGIVAGFASLAFVRAIYWFEDLFDAIPGNYYTRHMLGMLLMGVMMYLFLRFSGHYYVQGVGYASIVNVLYNLITNPWFLLLLFACKFLATCLTLGSGASGGIFSPSLFMGATLGYLFGYIVQHLFPELGVSPVLFAVAGMAALVASSTGAIITGITMVLELTRNYDAIFFIIIAAAVAYGIRKFCCNESIYTLKLLRRGEVLPEGLQAGLMASKHAHNVMAKNLEVVAEAPQSPAGQYLVLHNEHGFQGVITPEQQPLLQQGIQAESVLQKAVAIVPEKTKLPKVITLLNSEPNAAVLVAKHKAKTYQPSDIVGVVTNREIVADADSTAQLCEASCHPC